MPAIGRNDPYPCGSGKKYKKCCLAETTVVSTEKFQYQRLSEAYNRGFNKMAEYAASLLGPEALDRAMAEYWPAMEMVPEDEEIHRQMPSIKGALVSTQAIWHIPIVSSESIQDTKNLFLMMGRQVENCSDVVPLRGGYRPKRLKSRQLYILQGIPQVGPTVAKRLLNHFGSISKMCRPRFRN
jgi:hypothetical protein